MVAIIGLVIIDRDGTTRLIDLFVVGVDVIIAN